MQGAAYYRFLASTLDPGELGRAALRRLRRRVGRAAVPHGSVPLLLSSLGLVRVEDLAHRMREDRAGRGPIEPAERAEARALVRDHLPGHAAELCAAADRVLAGELYLLGRWREHSRDDALAPEIAATDWTRDPLHGGHAPERPATELDVLSLPVDPRAVWEAGRLGHVVLLAQAWNVAGLPGTEHARGARNPGLYARAAAAHLRDFLATQPPGFGIHWASPMEVALRAAHLCLALSYLREAPELDALLWADAAVAVWDHARFVDRAREDGHAVPGNHFLADLAGLCVVGCLFPELPGAGAWRSAALSEFSEELVRQTTADGFSFESSLPYHRFVTELGLLVQAVARRQGLSLSGAALERLWGLCIVAEEATLPDGRLVNLGDNDSSRGFSLHLRPALDTAHIGSLRTALGGPGGAAPQPEALWLGGVGGFHRVLESGGARRPRPLLVAGGLAVLKSGESAVTLWAGSNGQRGLGGHAHNDKLACEIVLGGRRIVVDPGSPVYVRDPEERNRFRSTRAHPTAEVDGQEQSPLPRGRLFLLPEAAHARLERAEPGCARGEHGAYSRLSPPVTHRREVLLASRNEAVWVIDRFVGEGVHLIDVRWPLSAPWATLRAATAEERDALKGAAPPAGLPAPDPGRVVVVEVPEEPGGRSGERALRVLIAVSTEQPWEGVLEESTWSPGYGERICGRTARLRVRAQLPAAVGCLFLRLPGDAPRRPETAEAETR